MFEWCCLFRCVSGVCTEKKSLKGQLSNLSVPSFSTSNKRKQFSTFLRLFREFFSRLRATCQPNFGLSKSFVWIRGKKLCHMLSNSRYNERIHFAKSFHLKQSVHIVHINDKPSEANGNVSLSLSLCNSLSYYIRF